MPSILSRLLYTSLYSCLFSMLSLFLFFCIYSLTFFFLGLAGLPQPTPFFTHLSQASLFLIAVSFSAYLTGKVANVTFVRWICYSFWLGLLFLLISIQMKNTIYSNEQFSVRLLLLGFAALLAFFFADFGVKTRQK